MLLQTPRNRRIFRRCSTAAAWLSSARVVRRTLKCGNERNPHSKLNILRELPLHSRGRKERMTSSQHGAYAQGHTHPTMERTMGCQVVRRSQSHQTFPQLGLRAATRPHEHGIGSNRGSADRGEYVLAPCTHCPSSEESWECPNIAL
jgi:hypothetical protein